MATRLFFFSLTTAAFLLLNVASAQTVRSETRPWQVGADAAAKGAWVDVSHSLGFPLGGLGTGYSVFGRYGFVRVNFDGRPHDGVTAGTWEYTEADANRAAAAALKSADEQQRHPQPAGSSPSTAAFWPVVKPADELQAAPKSPDGFARSSFGFVVRELGNTMVLQTNRASWLPDALPFESAEATALPPLGRVVFADSKAALKVRVEAFTPLVPHQVETSAIPVQVFDVEVENTGNTARSLVLSLENAQNGAQPDGQPGRIAFTSSSGSVVFAATNGEVTARGVAVHIDVPAGANKAARFYISWYFPRIDSYRRYYTRQYSDASAVIDAAVRNADRWRSQIIAWHRSIDVPPEIKRLWFSSLASVMTSTVLTTDPYFFEIETPHPWLNTMDVGAYSSWAYLINWPEIERMDMDQYVKAMPETGPRAGLVWHSLWTDAAKYVEEPTFMVRFRRDSLWFNDPAWTRHGYAPLLKAAGRVFSEDHQDGLIVSKHGNQSYDIWRMPGISSYVNSAWVYGLGSLSRTARSIDEPASMVAGEPSAEVLQRALTAYDRLLWNPKTQAWDAFHRTAGADPSSLPDTLFTDQLFGRWMVAIDRMADEGGLPRDKIRQALSTLYTHNCVDDRRQNFRGWVNGMRPDGTPDFVAGYHARTFWFGAQLDLASLLGLVGDEKASLDVIRSVSSSLGNNALAAGEWNRSLDREGRVVTLPEEPCKDTPRFAPYPRYKSSWEYLVRIVGLTLDESRAYFAPFKTLDFELNHVRLAGIDLQITVESNWTRVLVDGKTAACPVSLDRNTPSAVLEFLR